MSIWGLLRDWELNDGLYFIRADNQNQSSATNNPREREKETYEYLIFFESQPLIRSDFVGSWFSLACLGCCQLSTLFDTFLGTYWVCWYYSYMQDYPFCCSIMWWIEIVHFFYFCQWLANISRFLKSLLVWHMATRIRQVLLRRFLFCSPK